jgi:hypothetical protein
MTYPCRHCGSPLEHPVIDLGHQPPSNAYLTAEQLLRPEITYPLQVYVCTRCWLVQLPAHAAAEELFTPDYAYFSSTSSSWCAHAERFVAKAVERLGLGACSRVVELASNDGYLLQYVQQRAHRCHSGGGAGQGHHHDRALLWGGAGGGAGTSRSGSCQQCAGPCARHQRLRGRHRPAAQAPGPRVDRVSPSAAAAGGQPVRYDLS